MCFGLYFIYTVCKCVSVNRDESSLFSGLSDGLALKTAGKIELIHLVPTDAVLLLSLSIRFSLTPSICCHFKIIISMSAFYYLISSGYQLLMFLFLESPHWRLHRNFETFLREMFEMQRCKHYLSSKSCF